jgi:hypothetical protein
VNAATYVALVLLSFVLMWIGMWMLFCHSGTLYGPRR